MNRVVGHLVVTRGMAGFERTDHARSWVAQDPERRCRIGWDDLRKMLHDRRRADLPEGGSAVTITQRASVLALLTAGFDVVSDDPWSDTREIRELVAGAGAAIDVWDMRDVPPEVCIERDAARSAIVGAEVINDLHRRYMAR